MAGSCLQINFDKTRVTGSRRHRKRFRNGKTWKCSKEQMLLVEEEVKHRIAKGQSYKTVTLNYME